MVEAMRECGLPAGVYQVATGLGVTGQALIDEVDMVMFTGSTATGKKVMERAARTLTPVSLELGGKDPMIVLADADLERAANAATYYSMQNGGQTCISVERVYVEAPVYDAFVAKVAGKVAKLRRSPISGDWRRVNGSLELTAALAVNVPAFPVYAMDNGDQTALVAAGTLEPYEEIPTGIDPHVPMDASLIASQVAAQVIVELNRAADRVEHDTGALPSSDFVDLLHQILFFRCDDILGTCSGELLSLRTRTSERDRLRADGIGDLDCCKPHAARCTRNDHGVL